MFEKEARERANQLEEKQTLGIYDNDEDLARDKGFNDGQVVGYEEGFNDGAEYGYNKANEWHDLRKNPNDLPNATDEVLVCYKNGYIDTWLYFKDFKHEAVIGWKYLPKPLN